MKQISGCNLSKKAPKNAGALIPACWKISEMEALRERLDTSVAELGETRQGKVWVDAVVVVFIDRCGSYCCC